MTTWLHRGGAEPDGGKGAPPVGGLLPLFASLPDGHMLRTSASATKRQPDASERAPRVIRHKSQDLRVPIPSGLTAADPTLPIILELVHKSRHLRANLKRWMQQPATPPLHVLLADPNRRVLDSLTQSLERVAASNVRFGLPPIPLMISRATSVQEATSVLRRRGGVPVAIALVNLCDGMAADYMPQQDEWASGPNEATIFVGYAPRCAEDLRLDELYMAFGVIDLLPDLSDNALRTALHKWMPRSCTQWGHAASGSSASEGAGTWSPPLVPSIGGGMRRIGSSSQFGGHAMPSPLAPATSADVCMELDGCSLSDGAPFCVSPAGLPPLAALPPPSPLHLGQLGASAGRIPPGAPSPHLSATVRLLLVAACPRSASTLQHYCDTLDIWLDVVPTGEAAVARLQHDLHKGRAGGARDVAAREATQGVPAEHGQVADIDVLQGEGGAPNQLPGAAGAPGAVLDRRYDLIVVEPDLEGMSGYALCSWYKEAARGATHCASHAAVKFVALSEEPDIEAAAAFGVDYSVAKPLSAACFARLLLLWLNS
mmetsp:Transcript_26143/g.69777  ORF Transcript_26143/g.69777 Transcript_26143/m.69777 type:complete len:543 (+) Transcript_26143:57-1685(+)